MPKPGQKSVTLKKSVYKKAEDYVKENGDRLPHGKSVAGFVTELIIEKTSKEAS